MASSSETSSRRLFKLSKKLLSETYKFVPEAADNGQDYHVDVKPRTKANMPFMILFEGPKSIIGSVRRPANSPTFDIGIGGSGYDDGDGTVWKPMRQTGSKEAVWPFTMPDGKEVDLSWKGTNSVVVDGKTKQGIAGGGYKLVDGAKPDDVLAVFTPERGISAHGVMQLNVNWGVEFEQMVIMTFMCLYDRISSYATNSIGWGVTGAA